MASSWPFILLNLPEDLTPLLVQSPLPGATHRNQFPNCLPSQSFPKDPILFSPAVFLSTCSPKNLTSLLVKIHKRFGKEGGEYHWSEGKWTHTHIGWRNDILIPELVFLLSESFAYIQYITSPLINSNFPKSLDEVILSKHFKTYNRCIFPTKNNTAYRKFTTL